MRLNNGAPVWGYTGADPGQSSFMLYNSEKQIGAIVLANRFADIRDLIERGGMDKQAEGIALIVYKMFLNQ